jgi:hypothetical protein
VAVLNHAPRVVARVDPVCVTGSSLAISGEP